jgi:hypothetical protein
MLSVWACVLLLYYGGGSSSIYLEARALSLEEHQNNSQVEKVDISGESFGNNGRRFQSFIECAPDQKGPIRYFSGGSHLIMSATVLDNKQIAEGTATGSWQLDFHANGESSTMKKAGIFYSGQLSDEEGSGNMAFTLRGIEISDTACGGAPKHITIRAMCAETSPVYYVELEGDRVGSTSPPLGDNIYHLFGHNMKCVMTPHANISFQ